MGIKYEKLLQLIAARGETSYTMTKKNKIIGQATWKKLHDGGDIDTRTIGALCAYFDCQPGDLLSYEPDEEGSEGKA